MEEVNRDLRTEDQPRKTGLYLANVPGLTDQRIVELYRGVAIATGDAHAKANLHISAKDGLTLVVLWTQANEPRSHREHMPASAIFGVMDRDEDQVFTAFATKALEAVRARSLAIDADPETPAVERSFSARVREAAGAFTSMLAQRRLHRQLDEAQQPQGDSDGRHD